MLHTRSTSRVKSLRISVLAAVLFLVFLPAVSFALTPIAQVDVVPYQRIAYGSSFNFGVIAFSKAGIDRVEFTITGQGYSGGVKTASSMTYNSRTDVYEYWMTLKSSDFSTDGAVSIQVIVYGKDGGTRNLGTTPLVVNATGNLSQPKAWVSPSGNNATGKVGAQSTPFATIEAAVDGLLAANGNNLAGCILYLEEGSYDLAGAGKTRTVSGEWFTITKSANATKTAVIINAGGSVAYMNWLKLEEITIQSKTPGTYVFSISITPNLWADNCRIIGSGRVNIGSNPILYHTSSNDYDLHFYATNTYVYDVYEAFRKSAWVRGCTIEKVGNDVFHNTYFVVNTTVDNVTNSDAGDGAHSDTFQIHTANEIDPQDNIIIYNYRATDAHYQGLFLGSNEEVPPNDVRTNIAIVNVLVEMRNPADDNESGIPIIGVLGLEGGWDHLLIWNSSFPYAGGGFYQTSMNNSSIVGNIFWDYRDTSTAEGVTNLAYSENGNPNNNEFLYNHFINVRGVTSACTPTATMVYYNQPCPFWFAKAPDSGATQTYTTGEGVIDISLPLSDSFGMPVEGSVLIDRIPFSTVPADLYGNLRVGNSDVGAVERTTTQSAPPSLTIPAGFQEL